MAKRVSVQRGRPRRPAAVTVINHAGRMLESAGIVLPALEPEALLAEAVKKTGLSDFGGDGFLRPLGLYCGSLNADARLNTLGRMIAKGHIIQMLINRLMMADYRKKHPGINDETVARPLFIIGLPRTGTTILHSLLGQDPANRSPLSWETLFPCPPPQPGTYFTDPRIKKIQKQFDQLYKLARDFEAVHPMAADMPQECVVMWSHEFMSPQFFMQFNVSSYQKWLDRQDMAHVYRAHRRFLQFLQHGGVKGERWLLKSPGHLNLIETLLDTYPDALIIQTHREPVTVIASLTSLAAMLRGISSDYIDTRAIGAQFLDWYEGLLARSVSQRERLNGKSGQFIDLSIGEITTDPIGCVERIYDRFNFTLAAPVRDRMVRFMKDNPRDRHGSHTYLPEDFGIDVKREQGRFQGYIDRFCL